MKEVKIMEKIQKGIGEGLTLMELRAAKALSITGEISPEILAYLGLQEQVQEIPADPWITRPKLLVIRYMGESMAVSE